MAETAEAVVVGSAIVHQIAEHGHSADLVPVVADFVRALNRGVKSVASK